MRLRQIDPLTDTDWERDEVEFANHRTAVRALRSWLNEWATRKGIDPPIIQSLDRAEARALLEATTPARLKGTKR